MRNRMPNYITCEADLNFPNPGPEQVVAQLRAISAAGVPVPVNTLASSLKVAEGIVIYALRRAEQLGWARQVPGRGWVVL